MLRCCTRTSPDFFVTEAASLEQVPILSKQRWQGFVIEKSIVHPPSGSRGRPPMPSACPCNFTGREGLDTDTLADAPLLSLTACPSTVPCPRYVLLAGWSLLCYNHKHAEARATDTCISAPATEVHARGRGPISPPPSVPSLPLLSNLTRHTSRFTQTPLRV